MPQGLNKRKSVGPIAKLVTMQNKYLRSITGAYQAINPTVLEVKARVTLLDLHLKHFWRRQINSAGKSQNLPEIDRQEKKKEPALHHSHKS